MRPRLANGVKTRKHHNTKGLRRIKRGRTADSLKAICKRLGMRFSSERMH